VLTEHTYDVRAATLRDLLLERSTHPTFELRIGAPNRRAAQRWGDLHLAEALGRALSARGSASRVSTVEEWTERRAHAADVVVHLKGRNVSPRAEGQVHVLWVISHPEEVTEEECDAADLVLVASERFAAALRTRTSTPVDVLLQATDERRFAPRPRDPRYSHPVAFVGNSRFAHRPAVDAAIAQGLAPAIYGDNWVGFASTDLVVETHVPNAELPILYSSVDVLLNDHWDDMRRWGFVSNRCYDALACGAVVVSDALPELDQQLDGAVAVFTTDDELGAIVRRLLADPDERTRRAARGRAAVLGRHTFGHRADELLEHLRAFVPDEVAIPAVAGSQTRAAAGGAGG
jgi:O-antigen biosynthesis protein